MKKLKPALLIVLIVILLAGNVFFFLQTRKPDYEIRVGKPLSVPVVDEAGADLGRTLGVDFSRTTPLTKEEVSTVLMAFIGAQDYENTSIAEDLPDALMELKMPFEGAAHFFQINLWQEENRIVFSIGTETRCKAITNPYYVQALTVILDAQLPQ